MSKKQQQGFTLIELLVVIVIIGVLATLVTIFLNSAKSKAADAKKISDMRAVVNALEMYSNDEGDYPHDLQSKWGQPLIGPTSGKTYMTKLPNQPTALKFGKVCQNSDAIYIYQYFNNHSFTIRYCLDNPLNECPAGPKKALPNLVMQCKEVEATACIPNTNKICGSDGCGGTVGGCSGALKCKDDGSTASCVACLSDGDCNTAAGKRCINNNCLPCDTDTDCSLCSYCKADNTCSLTANGAMDTRCGTAGCNNNLCNGFGVCQSYKDFTIHNCAFGQICSSFGFCCVQKSCSQLGRQCGTGIDNCGGSIDCGVCDNNNTCDAGGQCACGTGPACDSDHLCVSGTCVAKPGTEVSSQDVYAPANWVSIDCDSNCNKIVAVANGNANGGVYISTNGGTSWTKTTPGPCKNSSNITDWTRADYSNDGSTILATCSTPANDAIYVSRDDGATWTVSHPQGCNGQCYYNSCLNNDGSMTYIYAATSKYSSNYGVNWTDQPYSYANGRQGRCSANGSRVALATIDGTGFILVGPANFNTAVASLNTQYGKAPNVSPDGQYSVWGSVSSNALYYHFGSNTSISVKTAPITNTLVTSIDNTGQVIYLGGSDGKIYKTSNAATTWSELTGATKLGWSWSEIDTSVDGMKIFMAANQGGILKSTNNGATWSIINPLPMGVAWTRLAATSNGQNVIGTNNNKIYYSSDYGHNWLYRSLEFGGKAINPSDLDVAQDTGTLYVANSDNNNIYKSSDYGTSWSELTSANKWATAEPYATVASSGDGQKVIAGTTFISSWYAGQFNNYHGYFMVSTDGGSTWTNKTSYRQWSSSDVSRNGSVMMAVANDSGSVYTSTDSGATFTDKTPPNSPVKLDDVSISDTGQYAVTVGDYKAYFSSNYGATWTLLSDKPVGFTPVRALISGDGSMAIISSGGSNSDVYVYYRDLPSNKWQKTNFPSNAWNAFAASSDLTKIIAGPYDGGIFTSP